MTVLVTGSRGTVATTLIPLLLKRGVAVRAGSAGPSRSSLPDGVLAVPCNLRDPATFPAALEGVDSVFLYAEPSEIDAFIEEAAAAGVGHIVLLSSTSALDGPSDNPLGDKHLTVEKALSASSVQSTFLRSGTFAGNALAWAWPIKAGKAVDLAFPGAHTDPVHELDVAEAALAALIRPAAGWAGPHPHWSGVPLVRPADRNARRRDRPTRDLQPRHSRRVENGDGGIHPGCVRGLAARHMGVHCGLTGATGPRSRGADRPPSALVLVLGRGPRSRFQELKRVSPERPRPPAGRRSSC
jgi:hypothetical protein